MNVVTNSPSSARPSSVSRLVGYLWTGVAIVACPCHLPLIVGALAGTAAGALLSRHWIVGLLGLLALFLVSAAQAWRRLSGAAGAGACELR